MSSNSKIEWTHHTFNPWIGCTAISVACDHCYARKQGPRHGVHWGPGQPRRQASERMWAEPMRWERSAARAGERRRVFCASMADVFDNEGTGAPLGASPLHIARQRLWELIAATPHLDWLLLTKRIGNAERMLPEMWVRYRLPVNVWLGTTVGSQEELDRDVPKLQRLNAYVRFISAEPLLEPMRLNWTAYDQLHTRIHWLITGAESGHGARPMDLDWVRSLRDQCQNANIKFFFKQDVRAGVKISLPLLDGVRHAQIPDYDDIEVAA